ncbi:POK8 protein, partial [Sagittarius serpentarius]|nr:POK8 protein [Sagittarius serpentarius]
DILLIDLKDCFFTIPLHPHDCEKFAFSVPSINKAEPTQRYQWVVLPQGMKNSSALWQLYVAWALKPSRTNYPELLIYHYTDGILVAGNNMATTTILSELQL